MKSTDYVILLTAHLFFFLFRHKYMKPRGVDLCLKSVCFLIKKKQQQQQKKNIRAHELYSRQLNQVKRTFLKGFLFSPTYHQRQLLWTGNFSSSIPLILNHYSGLHIHWENHIFLYFICAYSMFSVLVCNTLIVSVFILSLNMNVSSFVCIYFI